MVRGMLSFSVIHIFLVIITFICGLYSIRDYRYTYKRLTGMLYVLTGNNDFNYMKIFLQNNCYFFLFFSSCFTCCLY